MTDIRLFYSAQIQLEDGNLHTVGNTLAPAAITGATGLLYDMMRTIASGSKSILWDATEDSSGEAGNTSAFKFALVTSDLDDVELEITVDVAGAVGTELHTVQLKKDMPYILGSNVSYANYTADFAAGTLDVVERLRANNPVATGVDANIRVVVVR